MFFFPLFDDNPTRQTPYISWAIMAICVIMFLWQQSLEHLPARLAMVQLGFIPGHATGVTPLPDDLVLLPAWMTIFTSMFLHGGWMHIGGNMLYLWIFGDNVEESMGRVRFILFYAAGGTAAAMAQAAIDPASPIPMIGASGGIAAVLGAYLMLHPKAAIRSVLVIIVFIRFIKLPAWLVLGVWIGGQFVAVPQALANDGGGVAYFAHIGGFVAGIALVAFFKRGDVPLFGRDDTPPERWDSTPTPFGEIKQEARLKYSSKARESAVAGALGSRIGPRHTAASDIPDVIDEPVKPKRHRGSVPSTGKAKRPASRPRAKPSDTPKNPWG